MVTDASKQGAPGGFLSRRDDGTGTSNMEKARDGKIWMDPKSQALEQEFSLWEGIGKSRAALQPWMLWKNFGLSWSRVISPKVSCMLIVC